MCRDFRETAAKIDYKPLLENTLINASTSGVIKINIRTMQDTSQKTEAAQRLLLLG